MMRSLFSGMSGLRNHQTSMDVIGNNIANVNTAGFKAGRVQFQDVLSQTLQGSSAGNGGRGGTNPMQIGLGMSVSSIDTVFTEGSFQPTGKQTDLSIQGQGFFLLTADEDAANIVYTRSGNFDFDGSGNMIMTGTGYRVVGYSSQNGVMSTKIGPIKITELSVPPKASTKIEFVNNLNAQEAIGKKVQGSAKIYDSLGNAQNAIVSFMRIDNGKWLYSAEVPGSTGVANQVGEITFDSKGKVLTTSTITPNSGQPFAASLSAFELNNDLSSVSSHSITVFDKNNTPRVFNIEYTRTAADTWTYEVTEAGVATPIPVASGEVKHNGTTYEFGSPASPTLDFSFDSGASQVSMAIPSSAGIATGSATITQSTPYTNSSQAPFTFNPQNSTSDPMSISFDFSRITQYGDESSVKISDQDGYPSGSFEKVSIDTSGMIIGSYDNGQSRVVGQVVITTFTNPGGLNKVGSNIYTESVNSGLPSPGFPGVEGRGTINPGSLEMSNVDLAQEFSNMIITQRGFQANSKIISTTDEMLQELANLKR